MRDEIRIGETVHKTEQGEEVCNRKPRQLSKKLTTKVNLPPQLTIICIGPTVGLETTPTMIATRLFGKPTRKVYPKRQGTF